MKVELQAVINIMNTIEVRGAENLRRLLACINTMKAMLDILEKGGDSVENKAD